MAKSLLSKTKKLISKTGNSVLGKDRLTRESDVRANLMIADNYASRYVKLKEANGGRNSEQVRNEINDYYETLSDDEKKEFRTSYNRTVKAFDVFVKHSKSPMIIIEPNIIKDNIKKHFENNSYGDMNEKAFDLMSVKLRENQMNICKNFYDRNLNKAEEHVNDYASEGVVRNIANFGHNMKERALAGLGNYNGFALIDKAMGDHEEVKPKLRESISSQDLLNKFENIKNISIDSFSEKLDEFDNGLDY